MTKVRNSIDNNDSNKALIFKNYLHFNNNKHETVYEVKRYLKVLFLKALKVSVSLISFGMLLKTFAPR